MGSDCEARWGIDKRSSSMAEPIRKIVIVGGGTSGWLAAAMLQAVLGRSATRNLDITLIESEDIGTIGVGEATVPTLRETLPLIGIDEPRFMKATEATFKHGIRFENWLRAPSDAPDDFYYHPFERARIQAAHIWSAMQERGEAPPYAYLATIQPTLCDASRSPKLPDSRSYQAPFSYAYHLDAILLARLLRDTCKQRGLRHIVDTVREVKLREDGFIDRLATETNGEIDGELFIDSTGFRGLLINQALSEPFDSFSDSLWCDRALTMRTPHASDTSGMPRINPFTTSKAQSAGWTWAIDLQSRRGNGYVYSSRYIDDDDAEAEFRRHLGPVAEGLEVNRLRMRIGHCRNSWVRNCVAVGLSSGFIEPLESTGIYLIEMAMRLLIDYFPRDDFEPVLIDSFNRKLNMLYDEIRDFIVIHYCLTQRRDTDFWRDYGERPELSNELRAKLALWQHRPASAFEIDNRTVLFEAHNWNYILAGMDVLSRQATPFSESVSEATLRDYPVQLEQTRQRALRDFPDHRAFLETQNNALQ
jgi:tryptophan halogenase